MRYWPLWTIAQSPLLATPYQLEMQQIYQKPPSEAAYYAAAEVARQTPAIEAPNLVIIESLGAPDRRVYISYPGSMEWLRLERATLMEHDGFTFFMVDALH